jgi:hypothetical protein
MIFKIDLKKQVDLYTPMHSSAFLHKMSTAG